MPEYRRTSLPGGSYFFTVNTLGRQPLLTKDLLRLALHQGIELARQVYPFTIDAWVLLPDHLHCIWTLPPGDSAFSKRWAMIKRHVTQQCNLGAGGDAGVAVFDFSSICGLGHAPSGLGWC